MRLDELYFEKKDLYERAIRAVEECINDIVKDFAGDRLFRVDRIAKRLKKLNSLKWKAYTDSIPLNEEAFDKITDIAGVRVIVNNLQDIQKIIDSVSGDARSQIWGGGAADVNDKCRGIIEEMGVEIIDFPPAEVEKFKKIGASQWDEWVNQMEAKGKPGKRVYDKWVESVKKFS